MESAQDYECAICINILVKPIKTRCGHMFCEKCMLHYLQSPGRKLQCPVCRHMFVLKKSHDATMKYNFEPQDDVWDHIKSTFSSEIEQRVKELNEIAKAEKNIIKINFKYGNSYTQLDTFTVTKGGNEVRHKWKVYVKTRDEKLNVNKFISRVTFKLHELYLIDEVKKRAAPF